MHSDDATTATAPATSDSQPNSKRSNTYASLANSNLSTQAQAQLDLAPLLEEVGLAKKGEAIAKTLATQHRTWGNAVNGLHDWMRADFEGWNMRMDALKISVGDMAKLKRALEKRCRVPPSRCAATVVCGDVKLKLTLTPKFMEKPLSDALLAPFLKAYSKKAALAAPATVDDVATVKVDGELIDDYSAPVQKLVAREEAGVTIVLKEQLAEREKAMEQAVADGVVTIQ